jgi:hypothetical protein
MRRVLLLIAIATVAAAWCYEKTASVSLQAQLATLARTDRELASLQAEQQRLNQRLPSEAEMKQLLAAATEANDLKQAVARRTHPGGGAALGQSAVGEWSPASTWRNRGIASPRDTVETALWAATGGDTTRFSQLLELSDEVRTQATALLEQLPMDSQLRYPNVEGLIAAFTVQHIPIGPAQIVSSRQPDADHATLGVFVKDPTATPAPPAILPAQPEVIDEPQLTREEAIAVARKKAAERKRSGVAPPSITPNAQTTFAYLSLHRNADGWRLVVPASAIKQIAKELATPTGP